MPERLTADARCPVARLRPGAHPGGLWVLPIYRQQGFDAALADVWVRAELVPRLERAALALGEHGHGLLVWDGWRSPELQRTLYEDYRDQLASSTGLSGPALEDVVARYVTDPDRRESPPAHLTGGALDVTLCDPDDGRPRAMGGEFDELSERSMPGHYDGAGDEPSQGYARLRQRLNAAMDDAGFVRLPTEWWHFEYGTDLWSRARGRPALYGPIAVPLD